ncbi:nucleoside hydrolase [Bacteroidota bacterium]
MSNRLAILLAILSLSTFQLHAQALIIFDTDLGGDADDLAALAMLHNFHKNGECKLLAVMSWSTEEFTVPAIDAIGRYYEHPGIPIGVRKHDTYRDENAYGKAIADKFPYELTPEKAPDATRLYRDILGDAEANSIVIVTVGPLYNIKALIESGPDSYSKLNGKELIHEKVKEFVIMGGQFPEGENEWNFNGNMEGVTKFVIENIDLPIIFSGFEVGVQIKSAAILNERKPDTPLFAGFMHFSSHASWMKDRFEGKILDNSSFDQTAVLHAVRNGVGDYWDRIEGGRCVPDKKGGNTWAHDPTSKHSYLKLLRDPEEMATLIEAIMLEEE